jgi:hypothetical protein
MFNLFRKPIVVVNVPFKLEDWAREQLQKQVASDIEAERPVVLTSGVTIELK